jgi:hypothetical protein
VFSSSSSSSSSFVRFLGFRVYNLGFYNCE